TRPGRAGRSIRATADDLTLMRPLRAICRDAAPGRTRADHCERSATPAPPSRPEASLRGRARELSWSRLAEAQQLRLRLGLLVLPPSSLTRRLRTETGV